MNLEVELYQGELFELRQQKQELERYRKMFMHIFAAEKVGSIYFICGEGGEKDQNNLPDRIHVCPTYGVDWFQVYQKTDQTHGPEW
jgi:hypothetical protein